MLIGKYMPLHLALFDNQPTIAQLLLDTGADVSKPMAIGVTHLSYAIGKRDLSFVKLLSDAGAKSSKLGLNDWLILKMRQRFIISQDDIISVYILLLAYIIIKFIISLLCF